MSTSKHVELPQPELSLTKATQKYNNTYLTGKGCRLVTRSEHCVLDGEPKYAFLRRALPMDRVRSFGKELSKLEYTPVAGHSRRKCMLGSPGGFLNFGWHPTNDVLFKPSEENELFYYMYLPVLIDAFAILLHQHFPEEWRRQTKQAEAEGNRLIGSPKWEPRHSHRVLRNPIFSSVAVNVDTKCRSHTDSNNKNGLSCMTTFGDFDGVTFCMPRLGVMFDVQPGDVLIADTNREQHGNVSGKRKGERISVIAYLRELA
jgi:hypothetical protein